VRAKRYAGAVEISNQPLFGCHGPQWSRDLQFMFVPDVFEERARRLSSPLGVP